MKTGRYAVCGLAFLLIMVAGAKAWQQPYLPPLPSPPPLPGAPQAPSLFEPRRVDFKSTGSISPPTPLIKSAENSVVMPAGNPPPMSTGLPEVPSVSGTAPPTVIPSAAPENKTLNAAPVTAVGDVKLAAAKQAPALTLEWVPPDVAKRNQPMACQILVRNTSTAAVHKVEVRQPLPQGVNHVSSEPKAIIEERELLWQLGTIEPGQTRRLDLKLLAQSRGNLQFQAQVSFSSAIGTNIQVKEPLLVLKTKCPEKSLIGEPVHLQLILTNPGDGVTENIKIKTVLTEGLEHSRGKQFEVPVGHLQPNETRTLQLVVQAKAGGKQEATFTVAADGNLTSADTATLDILTPRLELELAGPKLRYIDRPAVYALRVSNRGTAPTGSVSVSEVVPAGFKFHAASNQGKFDEATRTVNWTLSDLAPGQKQEVSLELVASKSGEHRLQAQASAAKSPRAEAQTVTRVEGLSDLQLELADKDDPVEVNAETQFEIRLANAGTQVESNVHLTCTLPANVEFRAARNAANLPFRVDGKTVVFEPLPKLAPRADVVYRITVRCLQPGTVRWRASVRTDSLTEPQHKEESTRIYNDQ